MSGDWLIPWTARGRSGAIRDNFLWRRDRLYVMDNHRLALWCWWQHLAESDRWSFLHIDRHYDSLWQKFDPWSKHTRPEHRSSLHAFRDATFTSSREEINLYRWDTITSALWSLHSDVLADVRFATAGEGDLPLIPGAGLVNAWDLPTLLRHLSKPKEEMKVPQIVDVDIDYFTHHDLDGTAGQLFSDTYIRGLGNALREGLQSRCFGMVTVALSPDTTGSWELAEHILSLLLSDMDGSREFWAARP